MFCCVFTLLEVSSSYATVVEYAETVNICDVVVFMWNIGIVGLKSRRSRKLQFFNRCCIFPTERIMNAENFDFTPKISPKWEFFSPKFGIF